MKRPCDASSSMKRPCDATSSSGDSEEDMEETIDVGSEDNYLHSHNNGSFIRCGSPTTTTQVMARKKRRGIIEKRRRDRINNSLSELRRLIPTAFEKQGSAKLEKAEILQMTVDHLKVLQATGGKGYLDAHALALDFLSLGFRECVTEVSRYLGNAEGLDPSDPLRLRLLSHLSSCISSCASSQRDPPTPGLPPHHLLHHHHPHLPSTPALHHFHPHHWAAAIATATSFHPLPFGLCGIPGSPESGAVVGGGGGAQRPGDVSQHLLSSSSSSSPASSYSSQRAPSAGPPLSSASLLSLSAQLLPLGAFLPHASVTPPASSSSSSSSSAPPQSGSTKPYRPWGTEVGAF